MLPSSAWACGGHGRTVVEAIAPIGAITPPDRRRTWNAAGPAAIGGHPMAGTCAAWGGHLPHRRGTASARGPVPPGSLHDPDAGQAD